MLEEENTEMHLFFLFTVVFLEGETDVTLFCMCDNTVPSTKHRIFFHEVVLFHPYQSKG
jgi:hypothetical protein